MFPDSTIRTHLSWRTNMKTYAPLLRLKPGASPHEQCPDYDSASQACRIGMSQAKPSVRQRAIYCTSDDYDNCPIYLCNALRQSRTEGLDRDDLLVNDK
jgi:hypothetical protein